MQIKYKYLTIILGLIITISFYVSWTIIVLSGITNSFDKSIMNHIVSNRGEYGNFLFWFNRIVTEFGFTYAAITLLLITIILCKGDFKSIIAAASVGSACLFNELIKHAYNRERPPLEYRWMEEKSSSYPSGHSNTSTILYGVLIFVISKSDMKKKYKCILLIPCIIIPILVYISRLVLSVHYFSDVIGGLTNGLMFLSLGILIYEIIDDKTSFNGFKPYIEKRLKNRATE